MKRFKDILCLVDSSMDCQAPLERSVALAENNQANLTVAEVIRPVKPGIKNPEAGSVSADLQDALLSASARELDILTSPYLDRIAIQTKVLLGTLFLEVIREVLGNGRDLVIKTTETAPWLERLFGGDDMHLLRKCPCPVWLIKPEAPAAYRCILAAVDVDDMYEPEELKVRQALNRQILEMAISLALSEFAELHIVHAWQVYGESAMRGAFISTPEETIAAYADQVWRQQRANLDTLIKEAGQGLGNAMDYVKPRTHLVKGSARKEIPTLAENINADLIVMGTVARTGVPGFIMGNTAETILNRIDCSVLAIKPPGFKSPVTLEG